MANETLKEKKINGPKIGLFAALLLAILFLIKKILSLFFNFDNEYMNLFCLLLCYQIGIPYIVYEISKVQDYKDKKQRIIFAIIITAIYIFWYFFNFREDIDRIIETGRLTTLGLHTIIFVSFPAAFLSIVLYEAGKYFIKIIKK